MHKIISIKKEIKHHRKIEERHKFNQKYKWISYWPNILNNILVTCKNKNSAEKNKWCKMNKKYNSVLHEIIDTETSAHKTFWFTAIYNDYENGLKYNVRKKWQKLFKKK